MAKKNVENSNENVSKIEKEEVVEIGIDKLVNFENHPYKIIDESLDDLKQSITLLGVKLPLLVRPIEDGKYEIVSGHRRKRACEMLGIEKLPCIVRNLTRDEAVIEMVDSNIQREVILPSERAFAYKMKYDALKHQGKRNDLTSRQVVEKLESSEKNEISENIRQIQRYIRLTYLIPELLEMVDINKIAFTIGVELSFLTDEEQYFLLDTIESLEATPSLAQAQEMKRLSNKDELNAEVIDEIMSEEKANQIPKYEISYIKFKNCIPRSIVTPKEVEDYLLKCALVCKERGINVEKMTIKTKSKGGEAR